MYVGSNLKFKHIEKILYANGSSMMTIYVDKECWRNFDSYNMLFHNVNG